MMGTHTDNYNILQNVLIHINLLTHRPGNSGFQMVIKNSMQDFFLVEKSSIMNKMTIFGI